MHIVIIALVMDFSGLVLAEAVLSYVGIGVDPTMTSFGTMINNARMELGREPVVWWSLVAAFAAMFDAGAGRQPVRRRRARRFRPEGMILETPLTPYPSMASRMSTGLCAFETAHLLGDSARPLARLDGRPALSLLLAGVSLPRPRYRPCCAGPYRRFAPPIPPAPVAAFNRGFKDDAQGGQSPPRLHGRQTGAGRG
jgi:hypothetical protein